MEGHVEQKGEAIIRCIKLGMALEEAYLLAECTADERELLSRDAEYQARLSFHKALKEQELLQKLDGLITSNVAIGKGEDLRWLLSKINRKRYGDGKGDEDLSDIAKRALGVAENLTAKQRMDEFARLQAEANRS